MKMRSMLKAKSKKYRMSAAYKKYQVKKKRMSKLGKTATGKRKVVFIGL